MDTRGIEPGAYCLQSRRDTTTPCTLDRFKQITHTHTVVTVASPPGRIRGCRIPHDAEVLRTRAGPSL